MRQDEGQFLDFNDDEAEADDSYLPYDDVDGTGYHRPVPRPLDRLLKEARTRLGLTQKEMAWLMGVSQRSYVGYEHQDVRKVPATALQLLAERTDISAVDLLIGYRPTIDYDAVVSEALSLQRTIWEICQRPDGNTYGMSAGLTAGEALALANHLLGERDHRRSEQSRPELQVTQRDIWEAIEAYTDFNRCADWEWERYNDPAYYGHAPFPCPVMYAVPQFTDMADYKRYSALRYEIFKGLTKKERDLYREWLGLNMTENCKGRGKPKVIR